jgi:glycosyltransferase involved in cell wall biosynthesis
VFEPLVSFVVLSYNFDRFLAECVDSILNQDGGHDFEVIVVDDASSDTTGSILAGLHDPRIRVTRHPHNRGHVATVNEALSYARGRYVARIDGDDRYRPGFLNTVIPLLENHPDVALVHGDVALMDATGRVSAATSDRIHAQRDFNGNELVALLEENFISAPTVIARRAAWQACLPVPDGLAFHDWYFTVMMARRHDFYYVNRVLADYRIHGANHHTRIVRDKTEEPSIFGLLDRVFSEVEASAELEGAKRRARHRIYGRHYLTLADKYFGLGMNDDARRCYAAAIRHYPSHLLNPGVQRRLAATVIGRDRYERGKMFFTRHRSKVAW